MSNFDHDRYLEAMRERHESDDADRFEREAMLVDESEDAREEDERKARECVDAFKPLYVAAMKLQGQMDQASAKESTHV